MFPIILSIGPLVLKSQSVMAIVAFLAAGFIFWRKGKEEHYSEMQLFDGFLLAVIFGLVLGRFGFILLNFSRFGWDVLKWVNLFSYPGSILLFSMVGSFLYLSFFSIRKKWDVYEILDFWAISYAIRLFFIYIGYFLDGSLFGVKTNLPWGVIFPEVVDKYHPTQLYFAVFFLVLYFALAKAEYKYRTFDWYRFGKKTAQTGFLLSVFIISTGLFSFIMTFLKMPDLIFSGIDLDRFIYFIFFLFGVGLLWKRSGRNFINFSRKKT